MNQIPLTIETAGPWLANVLDQFPDEKIHAESIKVISSEGLDETYRQLLAHTHHMTVTLEERYGKSAHLEVLKVRQDGNSYARKLILRAGAGGPVVLAGIMRFRLECVAEKVREEILTAETPLGRILIENQVLRKIETIAFLRFPLANSFGELLDAPGDVTFTFGRLAIIFCDGEPAVELLELIPPGIQMSHEH